MTGKTTRLRVMCRGAVQGVGFRPTVHRIASEMGLTGWIVNDPSGVTAEVEGPCEVVTTFPDRLREALPPLARVDETVTEEIPPEGATEFEVRESAQGRRAGALVPPDAALCEDCRREMETPEDRRHRYPFTTCTNCGPRFSLVLRLPYDRPQTAMGCFPLCSECEREYTDTADRRFHAEPVCCPACGPRIWFQDNLARGSPRARKPSTEHGAPCSTAPSLPSRASEGFNWPAAPIFPTRFTPSENENGGPPSRSR